MRPIFGDSHYFLALVNPRDGFHVRAVEFARTWRGTIVTTRWVLAEVCDGLSGAANRKLTVDLITRINTSGQFRVAPGTDELFSRGFDLYRRRPD